MFIPSPWLTRYVSLSSHCNHFKFIDLYSNVNQNYSKPWIWRVTSFLLTKCCCCCDVQKAYTSLSTSSMQILLLSAHACMHKQSTKELILVYALWQEVPKLVYAFWTCKPVFWLVSSIVESICYFYAIVTSKCFEVQNFLSVWIKQLTLCLLTPWAPYLLLPQVALNNIILIRMTIERVCLIYLFLFSGCFN